MLFEYKCGRSVAYHNKVWRDLLASLGVDAGAGLSLTLDYFTCWFLWWYYVNGRGILSVARLSSCRVDVLGRPVV